MGESRRVTRAQAPAEVRLLGFGLVVAIGAIVLVWTTRTAWRQLDRLQREHAAIKGESFYLGVHLRGALRTLNQELLQFGISRDPASRAAFLDESRELKGWIATNRAQLAQMGKLQLLKGLEVSWQLQVLGQIEQRYDRYLTNCAALLADAEKPGQPRSFETVYQDVRAASSPLFPLCDELVSSQRQGFNEFLGETRDTLEAHRQFLKFTSTLILVLLAGLGILVYRGMITPLRLGLSESEQLIERQEKLASLGILASGVAHEIRNPLTAIKIRLFSLRKSLPALAENEDAAVIGSEINRLEAIVKDFLQFARPGEPKLSRLEAGALMREVAEFLRPELERSGIDLRLETRLEEWIYGDAGQLKQVLINLVQNSAENIARNGTVTLRLDRGAAELEGRIRRCALLQVEDNGKGIPPEVESRMFDPFFTTKERGTGLGLAVSARIVEKHGGMLRYHTKLNEGTTFEIVLPELESHGTTHTVD